MIDGVVYFIRDGLEGPVKIGWSVMDPEVRLKQLQGGNPRRLVLQPIQLAGDRQLELRIHQRLKRHRIGGEWFKPHGEVLALMLDPADETLIALGVQEVRDRRADAPRTPEQPDEARHLRLVHSVDMTKKWVA